jgi:sugar phosphate isomerase/epimerase
VELAGYGNSSPREVRAALDDLGMRAISAHTPLDRLSDRPAEVFAELQTLGCHYVVLPWLGQDYRGNAEVARRLAGQLGELAQRCQDEGFEFAYHNHDFEFAPLDGSTMYEILTTGTDPGLVKLELDAYWAQYAGVDPVALLQQFSGRVPLLHVKDMSKGTPKTFEVVGEGIMPFKEILAAADQAGVEWYVIEHDMPANPMSDVERALRNLEQLAG